MSGIRVHGIRSSIPSGHLLGRVSSGTGAVELIPLTDAGAAIVRAGGAGGGGGGGGAGGGGGGGVAVPIIWGLTGDVIAGPGVGIQVATIATPAPQVTVLTAGTGIYATPAKARYLVVRMVGGGASGLGSGSGATGNNGASSTFGALTAHGGNAPATNAVGGVGGTATGGDINFTGEAGREPGVASGGDGGGSCLFGGAGAGVKAAGGSAVANTGGGGAGGG